MTSQKSVKVSDERTRALRRGLILYLQDLQRAGVQHLLLAVPEATEDVGQAPVSACPRETAASTQEPHPQGSPAEEGTMARRKEERVGPVVPPAAETPAGGLFGEQLPLATGQPPGLPSVELPSGATREEILAELARRVAKCVRCPELVANRTQTVFGVGNPYAELVFIGEAPGVDEDLQGYPFVGRAGQLLTAMITNGMGMRREDVYICNILRCRPPNNRTPTREEAANCRPWLDATLAVIRPKYICCLGSVAAQNLLGTDSPIGRLRGRVWEYAGAKVICTYHPAFLLRNPGMKREAWEDLKLLLGVMGRPAPIRPSPGKS